MPERTIGGSVFALEPMLAMRSFVLEFRLGPAFFEAIALVARAFSSAGAEAAVSELDVAFLATHAARIGELFGKFTPVEFESITRELLASLRMDNVPMFTDAGDPFEVKMRGRTIDVWLLLWFALEVHYPDFFARGRGFAASLAAKLKTDSAPSSTSNPAGAAGALS